MLSLNNFYNTDTKKRFYNPTCIFQVEEGSTKNFLRELLVLSNPTVVVYDPNVGIDTFIETAELKFEVDREPTESLVKQALLAMPEGDVNIIAIGGGSVIDFAKALVAHKTYGSWRRVGYEDTRFLADQNLIKPCKFIAVPTTPATGSEVSRYYLIKDSITNEKLVSRSWQVCPDFAILDPIFLKTLPIQSLVSGAFDAFSHSWETLFCKYECSDTTKLFAFDSIGRIIGSLKKMMGGASLDSEILSTLQYSATLGGLCLSNTRTGFLHTSGEALSAQVDLPHPYTLRVFFEACLKSYEQEIESLFCELKPFLPKEMKTVGDMIDFWSEVWNHFNLNEKISENLQEVTIDLDSIMSLILKDTVLVSKEHPSELDEKKIRTMVVESLLNYGAKIN